LAQLARANNLTIDPTLIAEADEDKKVRNAHSQVENKRMTDLL